MICSSFHISNTIEQYASWPVDTTSKDDSFELRGLNTATAEDQVTLNDDRGDLFEMDGKDFDQFGPFDFIDISSAIVMKTEAYTQISILFFGNIPSQAELDPGLDEFISFQVWLYSVKDDFEEGALVYADQFNDYHLSEFSPHPEGTTFELTSKSIIFRFPLQQGQPNSFDIWIQSEIDFFISSTSVEDRAVRDELVGTVTFLDSPELTVYSSISPSIIAKGDTFTLNVEVENAGVRPAEGVIIYLSLPAGLSAESVSKNIGQVGGAELAETSFEIHADLAGTYSIQTEVTADNAESITTTQTVKVLTPPQLSSSASLSPSTIKEGESATLTVEITNTGEQTAEDVKITITLPTGLSMTHPTRTIGDVRTIKQETFSIAGDTPGTYTVTVVVEASNTQAATTNAMIVVEETPETTPIAPAPEFGTTWSTILFGFLVAVPTLVSLIRKLAAVTKSENKRSST